MGYLDLYRKKIQNGVVGSNIGSSINIINSSFKNTPSYRLAKFNGIDKDIRVIKTDNVDEKKVVLRPLDKAYSGDIVEFDNATWIVLESDNDEINPYCMVKESNHTLKFYNPQSELVSIPVIAENKTLWTLGVSETVQSPLVTGDAKLNITMPDNNDTKHIDRDTRLICDSLCWRVTIKSGLKNGICTVVCGETQQMQGDDMLNEIPHNEYPLQTQPLTQFKTLSNSPYTITGDSFIRKTSTSTYIATNSEDTNSQFDFSIDFGNVPQSSIVVTIVDSNTIKIKNLTDSGEITLIATDKSNNQSVNKIILLKGLYDK